MLLKSSCQANGLSNIDSLCGYTNDGTKLFLDDKCNPYIDVNQFSRKLVTN
jgi:hypothetical protein